MKVTRTIRTHPEDPEEQSQVLCVLEADEDGISLWLTDLPREKACIYSADWHTHVMTLLYGQVLGQALGL